MFSIEAGFVDVTNFNIDDFEDSGGAEFDRELFFCRVILIAACRVGILALFFVMVIGWWGFFKSGS